MNGIERIAAERERQVEKEGWTQEHDSQHTDFQLSNAAVHYARESARVGLYPRKANDFWPWDATWWKPCSTNGQITVSDSIRMLEKAGALIAAEIDRLLSANNRLQSTGANSRACE